jgi:nicotinamidase-related amidase
MEILEPQKPGFIWDWLSQYYSNMGGITREYASLEPPMRRPGVLVIDFQVGPPRDMPSPLYDRALHNTSVFLPEARQLGLPIIYTLNSFREDLRDLPDTRITGHLNSAGDKNPRKILDVVAPEPDDIVVAKTTHSPFPSTNILFYLHRLGIDSLIVVGHTTSGCVRATAIDASMYGFYTMIPEECVGDGHGPNVHRANLCDMHCKGVDVMPLEELLTKLHERPVR